MTPLFGVIVKAGTLEAESVDVTPSLPRALRLFDQWARFGRTDFALDLSTGEFSTCIVRTVGATWFVQPIQPAAHRAPGSGQRGQSGRAESSGQASQFGLATSVGLQLGAR